MPTPIIDIALLLIGFVMLFLGGEGLLRGALSVAHQRQVSHMLVGVVLMGFGTSMPELMVCVSAVLHDSQGIAIGNVVGSNIANILLVLGTATLLAPITTPRSTIRRDCLMMLAATGLLCIFGILGFVTRSMAILMLAVLAAYLFYAYRIAKHKPTAGLVEEEVILGNLRPLTAWLFVIIGIVLLALGAETLVKGAMGIAHYYQVPEEIIGLTIIAVGSSLPELATMIAASARKHGDVVIGNILGSNIFNILAILGITASLQPLTISQHIQQFDLWVMTASTGLLAGLLWFERTLTRRLGIIGFTFYGLYIFVTYQQ